MDDRNKTAYECLEDYERYGTTVLINDGKVSYHENRLKKYR